MSTQMTSLSEILRQAIETSKQNVFETDTKFINVRGGLLCLPNGQSAPSIDAVILDYRNVNTFYPNAYTTGVKQKPACLAIGLTEAEMHPSPRCAKPQADTCATCPHNEWGTAGKGRRCKNTRRLALLPVGSTSPNDIHMLTLPPASLKNFDKHLIALRNKNLWLPNIKTQIGLEQGAAFTKFAFKNIGINDVDIELFNAAYQQATTLLEADYGLTD